MQLTVIAPGAYKVVALPDGGGRQRGEGGAVAVAMIVAPEAAAVM